jgi:hypothetical protein
MAADRNGGEFRGPFQLFISPMIISRLPQKYTLLADVIQRLRGLMYLSAFVAPAHGYRPSTSPRCAAQSDQLGMVRATCIVCGSHRSAILI